MDRKLNYLLSEAKIEEKDLNSRFEKIDKIMKTLKVGDKCYSGNCWGDIFERTVTKIIDVENGLVELYENSIKKTTVECVVDFPITIKEAKKWYRG